MFHIPAAPILIVGILLAIQLAHGSVEEAREGEDFAKGMAFFEEQKYEACRDVLGKLVRLRPGSALYWYNLGNTYVMLSQFHEATLAYQEVSAIGGPLAPAATLYQAHAQASLGHTEQALVLLHQLQNRKDLSPNLALWVEEEIARIHSGGPLEIRTRHWFFAGDFSTGWIEEPGYQAALQFETCFQCQEQTQLRLLTDCSFSDGFYMGTASVFTSGIRPALTRSFDKSVILFEPYIEGRADDLKLSLLGVGARTAAQFIVGKGRVGVDFSAGYAGATAEEFDYLKGSASELRTYWASSAFDPIVRAGMFIRKENIEETAPIPLSNVSYGPEANLSFRAQPGLAFELNGSLSHVRYPDATIDRRDWRASAGLLAVWRFRREIALHANARWSFDRSNLGATEGYDPSFSQISALTGISWELL